MKMSRTIIIEGRYDSITRKVVKDIMNVITQTKGYPDDSLIHIELPTDVDGTDSYYSEVADIEFNVEINITRVLSGEKGYVIESYKIQDEDVLEINMTIDENREPEVYESIFMKLQEDVRHEIEHLLQDYGRGGRPSPETDTEDDTTFQHHKRIEEVPAMVQGFYRRAKLQRRPLNDVMVDDLDTEIENGNLSKLEAEELLKIWTSYAKRRLPDAVYSKK